MSFAQGARRQREGVQEAWQGREGDEADRSLRGRKWLASLPLLESGQSAGIRRGDSRHLALQPKSFLFMAQARSISFSSKKKHAEQRSGMKGTLFLVDAAGRTLLIRHDSEAPMMEISSLMKPLLEQLYNMLVRHNLYLVEKYQ